MKNVTDSQTTPRGEYNKRPPPLIKTSEIGTAYIHMVRGAFNRSVGEVVGEVTLHASVFIYGDLVLFAFFVFVQ